MTASLKILHATAWYPPYSLGGTEVYVECLIAELRRLGIASTVIVPRHADAPEQYQHDGTLVRTYPVNDVPSREELQGNVPHQGFAQFRALVEEEPDVIYHQHSWTRGCGLDHLRCAHSLGLRTIVTVHVPSSICMRGTMMRYGEVPCDGGVEATKCGSCYLQSRGLPKAVSRVLANIPFSVAAYARRSSGRVSTALSARALGAGKREQLAAMIENADGIVAVCQWLLDALAANDAPPKKLHISRQGLPRDYVDAVRGALSEISNERARTLRILFLGRWHVVKGLDVLVRAIRALPADIEVQLTVHAIAVSHEDRELEKRVRTLAGQDHRIVFAGPLARSALATTMARNDVLAVPSTCLETGPLVVLEALAAGLYVLGSRLGGIAELVGDANKGELVEPGRVAAWTDAIQGLERRWRGGELKRTLRPVRTMDVVSTEMLELYRRFERRKVG